MLEPKERVRALYGTKVDIDIWLSKSGSSIALNWINNSAVGRYDYVALYDHDPTGEPYGYLKGQWQYITNQASPYVTGTEAQGSGNDKPYYWIAYVAYDYSKSEYDILAISGPDQP